MSDAWQDGRSRLAVLRPIEDAILRVTGNRYERTVFLAGDGRMVYARDGTADAIGLTPVDLEPFVGHVVLVTHNHPRSTSLTPEDAYVAMFLEAREINAFGTGVRYRLRRTGAVWPDPDTLDSVLADVGAELVEECTAHLLAGRLTDEQAELLYYHILGIRVAARLAGDLVYVREGR